MKMTAELIERTNNVYNIFKYIVALNQYRFADMHIDTVIDFLINFTGIDPSYISRQYLAKRIISYCNEYDTGIFF